MSAKYDFSKVSREALEAYAEVTTKIINNWDDKHRAVHNEVMRQARVRTPEEAALELAEYCVKSLNPDYEGQLDYAQSYRIREITNEYRTVKGTK